MTETRFYLGLDLGVTSVGWALLTAYFENGKVIKHEIVASGVRIFPATTEGTQNEPKNRARRVSRGTRRLLRRKRQRRRHIKSILEVNGLLPAFDQSIEVKFNDLGEPYNLRARGVTEKLEPFEIGRSLLHLIKRRGFKSNRKSGNASEDSVVYSGIAQIREEMLNSEFITLGSLLNSKEKRRKHYTAREMVEDEFDQLWATQSAHYPDKLTEYLRSEIRHTAFYQRPISSQRGLIGKCTFENGKKRCDMARQDAQRMRYWQDINNLKLQDRKTLDWRNLTTEQKSQLANALEKPKKAALEESDLRKLLGIGDDTRINLEKKLKGNTTAYKFTKAIGSKWDALSSQEQEKLTEDFIRIESEETLEKRLREFWKFTDKEVESLMKIELESGYSRCSLKAIRKILPKMTEGLRYDEAASAIYGDHRAKGKSAEFEQLPPPPSDLRNPIVTKALNEMRKVINAIIREYGKPDEIRLEMARELKLTKKQKDRASLQNKKNEAANKEAVEFFHNMHGIDPDKVSGTDKIKYRLAKESNWICPYTGRTISPESLLGDEWDIEHIIPYSRCFDDSYMNKTICEAKFNREEKLNKTPWELFGHDQQKLFEVGERIADLPYGKRLKFEKKEIDEEQMVNRMLSDTRYICREARGYLRQLYPDHNDENRYVQVVAGGSTAKLRYVWGINAILSDGDIEYKNRWDHRHHAIDAIVIALTDRALFQRISRLAARNEEFHRKELKGIEMPWEGFLDDVKTQMDSLVVSHATTRRIRGQLLEQTAYGATNEPGVYVTKKPVAALTAPAVKTIADPAVKEIIEQRIAEHEGNLKKAFAEPLFHKDGKTPIRNVRVKVAMSPETLVGIKDANGKEYKYYPVAGNHHVDIFENNDGERKAVLVPRFYAAQRNWKPAGLGPEWRKLFSLHANDIVEFRGDNGELRVLKIQKMSIGPKVIARPLNDARKDYISGSTQNIEGRGFNNIVQKLQVDPLGRLTQARD